MKKELFIPTAAVAFLLAFVGSFNLGESGVLALGNFSQSCKDIEIHGSELLASCRKVDGKFNPTSINLNPFIANVDGKLKWQPKNFLESCFFPELFDNHTLKAKCKTRVQDFVYTTINLDNHIANIDGNLRFNK